MTRTSRRFLIAFVVALQLFVAGVVAWHVLQKPKAREPLDLRVQATPERLARGEYLVTSVLGCFSCHAQSAPDRLGFPPVPGTEGMGQILPFPFLLVAPNITSDPGSGLGKWTDGEIMRALREGVGRDGRALFPMMPYESYSSLSDDDAMAVIAYLRTIPPKPQADLPKTKLPFPLPFFIASIPKPVEVAIPTPNPIDSVATGGYLARIAGCRECHTPRDSHERPIAGKEFFGGFEFEIPGPTPDAPPAKVVSANITPAPFTFVGAASREAFIARFKALAGFPPGNEPLMGGGMNSVMPWTLLAHMNAEDLGAIHDYLRTVPQSPVPVVTRPVPKPAPAK